MRAVPFMPYLNFAPSAWVLPLEFAGGGYRAGGKAMFDSEGNLWVGDNFTIGWQAQDALWQGNATKFAPDGHPLSPSPTGFAGGGMQGGTFGAAIDSKDNAWLASYGGKSIAVFDKNGKPLTPPEGITLNGRLGLMQGIIVTPSGDVWALGLLRGLAKLIELGLVAKTGGNVDEKLTRTVWEQRGGPDGGSVTLLRPDGTEYPGSPFIGGGLPGPWAAVVDGNDNVWFSNFSGAHSPLVELCGVRTGTCPPGMKTGDQISPPDGYVGGGLQAVTDLAIDPAGNIWLMNNWQDIDSCFGDPSEERSTLCGGQGVTVFYGMAKPVRAPQIGPARAADE
jgi:hypothetical protein